MDLDEEQHPHTHSPKNLEEMSIEALQGYIRDLEREIARAREAINGKQDAKSAADAYFK